MGRIKERSQWQFSKNTISLGMEIFWMIDELTKHSGLIENCKMFAL